MSKTTLESVPATPITPAAPDLRGQTSVRKVAKAALSKGPQEPPVRKLFRLLNLKAEDIFDSALIDAVDKSFQFYQTHPDSYLDTQFESEQEALECEFLLRCVADVAPNGPYTIRTVKTDDPSLLSWRAQPKRGSGKTIPDSETTEG